MRRQTPCNLPILQCPTLCDKPFVLQGRMGAAQQYLSLVPGDAAPDVAELKDRIHRSGAPGVNVGPEPMFPFIAEDVAVDPSAVQQSSAYSQQSAYSQNTHAGKLTFCRGFAPRTVTSGRAHYKLQD